MSAAEDLIRQTLQDYDLAPLTGQALGWLQQGLSQQEVLDSIRKTSQWQARFGAVRDTRRAKGLAPVSEGEVVAIERSYRSAMRAAGFPPGFYDQPSDFATLLGNDVSPAELDRRINDAYVRIAQAPPEVRQAAKDYFGVEGDKALAAFSLDPDKAVPALLQQVAAAEIGGQGTRFGFRFGADRAMQLAQAGVTGTQAASGLAHLEQLKPLFDPTISESSDLTATEQGANAVFNTGQGANEIERRLQERQAAFGGSGGSGGTGTKGGLGLGTVQS